MFDACGLAMGLGSAFGSAYSRPGQVIPMQMPYQPHQLRCDETLAQQQQLSALAQLQGQIMFADAMLAAVNHPRRVIRNYVPRKKHRERKFMRKTKAGYRARRTVEVLFWSAVGVVVLGGIVLPVGLRVYTSLWGWALGGG